MAGRTYRYAQANVRWPFGHGLSYSRFSYSDMAVSPTALAPCRDVNVSFTVANTGLVAATEVAQVYIRWRNLAPAVATPLISLADFARVPLQPGSTARVVLTVTARAMAVLTPPQCHGAPALDTALTVPPLATEHASSPGDCCSTCAAMEACEAYSFNASAAACALHAEWSKAVPTPGVVSGQPLPRWVVRPGELEVLVGSSSSADGGAGTGLSAQVTVTGHEDTPLPSCAAGVSAAAVR